MGSTKPRTALCRCQARLKGEANPKIQPNPPLKRSIHLLFFFLFLLQLKLLILIHAWINRILANDTTPMLSDRTNKIKQHRNLKKNYFTAIPQTNSLKVLIFLCNRRINYFLCLNSLNTTLLTCYLGGL